MLKKQQKSRIIKKHKQSEKDTGSPQVQVALLTKRINELTKHLKKNKKDVHSRRGLLQMVAQRKKLMDYLKQNDEKAHAKLAKNLKLKSS